MPDVFDDDIFLDGNGCPTERIHVGGQDVIVHWDDIPDRDLTVLHGIPCTTALRTVIDIAPNLEASQLEKIVQDALGRRLFTVEEALERTSEDDMVKRPGAQLLRHVLRR